MITLLSHINYTYRYLIIEPESEETYISKSDIISNPYSSLAEKKSITKIEACRELVLKKRDLESGIRELEEMIKFLDSHVK